MRRIVPVFAALAVALAAGPAAAQAVQGKTHLGGKPGALLSLASAGALNPAAEGPLSVLNPDGTFGEPFELPPGTALVVTDLIATTSGTVAAGTTRGGLRTPEGQHTNTYYSFTSPAETHHSIHLIGGALWTVAPSVRNAADSANVVFVEVHGYLVKSK
jgi:hypothetical protein